MLFKVEEKGNVYVIHDATKNVRFVLSKVRCRYVGVCGEAEDIRAQCSHQLAVREFLMERWSHGILHRAINIHRGDGQHRPVQAASSGLNGGCGRS